MSMGLSPVVSELVVSRDLRRPDQMLPRHSLEMQVRVDLPAQAGIVGEPNQYHGCIGRGAVREDKFDPVVDHHQVAMAALDRAADAESTTVRVGRRNEPMVGGCRLSFGVIDNDPCGYLANGPVGVVDDGRREHLVAFADVGVAGLPLGGSELDGDLFRLPSLPDLCPLVEVAELPVYELVAFTVALGLGFDCPLLVCELSASQRQLS